MSSAETVSDAPPQTKKVKPSEMPKRPDDGADKQKSDATMDAGDNDAPVAVATAAPTSTSESADDIAALARENFKTAVDTSSYWAVVDAQSEFDEWEDEYYSPAPDVELDDPILVGQFVVKVRECDDTENEEDGAGKPTEYSFSVGSEGNPTTLREFQTALLNFTRPRCEERKLPFNIYHLKHAGPGTLHLFMGD